MSRNALDKKEKPEFDEMWDIARLFVSACSNSFQLVPLHPITISIIFRHYKELLECIGAVEEMQAKVNVENKKCSAVMEGEAGTTPATLDRFFVKKQNH